MSKTDSKSMIEQLMRQGISYDEVLKQAAAAKTALEEEKKAEQKAKIEENLKKARIDKAAKDVAKAWLAFEVAYGNMKPSDVTDKRIDDLAASAIETMKASSSLDNLFSTYKDTWSDLLSWLS